jgi:hypothetical protein
MSPPIFTPDGSEVNQIVLPDGSEAREVVAPDGSVVFENLIPDSVVAQYDARDLTGYSDGNSVASTGVDGSGLDGTLAPDIGRTPNEENFFDGLLDDVRIYDKPLSSDEVSNLFNNGSIL